MSARRLPQAIRLALIVGVSLTASAAYAQDETLGSEFIDTPEEEIEKQRQEEQQELLDQGDTKDFASYLPGYQEMGSVGLSPHAPQRQPAMPGALTPSFGAPVRGANYRFSFSGYMQAVARASMGTRDNTTPDQKKTTLHGDPVVPGGSYGWFDHSMTVPTPWSQLNFTYGNDTVKATTIIGAWSVAGVDESSGYQIINAQVWFADAFLTYTPNLHSPIGLKLNVGAFPDRYGAMSKWHNGAYGTPLIAEIKGVGTTATLDLPFEGDLNVKVEGGFKGEMDKAPRGIYRDNTNEFARDEEGSTLAGHGHIGFNYKSITPTLHYAYSWSQDDRKDYVDDPLTSNNEAQQRKDGSVRILGADFRFDGERFGYLYFGAQHTKGVNSNSVTDMVRVLNTGSGKEFNEHFWGFASLGNGALTLVGGQYSLSLGKLLRYPMEFWGEGPDLNLSVFGIYAHVNSDMPMFDDKDMYKYGAEGVYSFSKYVASSLRIDHVVPDASDPGRSFGVFSPKLIFRSGWVTRESLTLQYAYYAFGDDVRVEGDTRLVNITSENPDRHLLALYGTIWW